MSGVPQNPPRGCTRVSVVIPCYNGERYLADTIRSVMRQEVGPTEIIVVDDGSTDGSREVVAAFGAQVRYARQPHGGAARARNLGAALATGTLLAFIDADDLWTEHALGALIAPLERDPRLESGEVTDWILRAEAAGLRFATVPQLVLRRRLHLLNHGVVRKDARQDYLKVVKAALDRRRAAAAQEGMA